MPRSGFTQFHWTKENLEVFTTDSETIIHLLQNLSKTFPSMQIRSHPLEPLQDVWKYTVEGLKPHGHSLAFALLRGLCERGWEPFSTEGLQYTSLDGFVKLRLQPTG